MAGKAGTGSVKRVKSTQAQMMEKHVLEAQAEVEKIEKQLAKALGVLSNREKARDKKLLEAIFKDSQDKKIPLIEVLKYVQQMPSRNTEVKTRRKRAAAAGNPTEEETASSAGSTGAPVDEAAASEKPAEEAVAPAVVEQTEPDGTPAYTTAPKASRAAKTPTAKKRKGGAAKKTAPKRQPAKPKAAAKPAKARAAKPAQASKDEKPEASE